jgi:hypothetical protein
MLATRVTEAWDHIEEILDEADGPADSALPGTTNLMKLHQTGDVR